jgi:hypothetical protein
MSVPELYEIFYAQFEVLDRSFEFWLTATFSVVVASHFMAGSMTRGLATLMALVYTLFSLAMAWRWRAAGLKFAEIRDQLVSAGEYYLVDASNVVGFLLVMTFVVGFSGALVFIWRSFRSPK